MTDRTTLDGALEVLESEGNRVIDRGPYGYTVERGDRLVAIVYRGRKRWELELMERGKAVANAFIEIGDSIPEVVRSWNMGAAAKDAIEHAAAELCRMGKSTPSVTFSTEGDLATASDGNDAV